MDCGWRLAKLAWRLLRTSRSLIALGLGFSLCAGLGGFLILGLAREAGANVLVAVGLGFVATLASVFLNVALALAADEALDGARMTALEALAEARDRLATIAGWAAIAVAVEVGTILLSQAAPERARLFVSLAAAGWSFAIFFVIPILALDAARPLEALRESVALLRSRWGEAFAGMFGIGGTALLASIPGFIVLAIGTHRNEIAPGSGTLAIVVGAVATASVLVLAAASAQVFTVALYRDATYGFPDAHDYVERRPRRKSWIVRIGLGILGLMLTLAVVMAIVGPRPAEQVSKVALPARLAPWITTGMPVVYEGQQVGEVKATEISGSDDVISFEIESAYHDLKGSSTIGLAEFEGRPCLMIVPRGQAPPGPGEQSTAGAA